VTNERGAAPVDAIFGIVILILLALSVIEVALVLYARNVVHASAHEGARVASELGASPLEAPSVVRDVVQGSVGGMVEGLRVAAHVTSVGEQRLVRVRVRAVTRGWGPIPIPVPVETTASATQETRP
jgi:TadE-like protein